ncbi:MAG: hypothetical protein KZQ80_02540 [Candidatus Thiodiazotropha sp. (ex Monitilora ramsayi)]|nr:hypothetical protein [Candidatus Thiodiazotropha sp. (ex Monitilora ramsayi)]
MTQFVKTVVLAGQLLCLSLLSLSLLAAEVMEIFELKGKTPQEMIPLIQPFVGPDGTVTGMHNQLIVRTSSERMAEVRKILDQFDRPPRRLLIHVRDTHPMSASDDRFEINADHDRVKIGRPGESGVRLKRYDTQRTDSSVRTLQTLEGSPTLILSGVNQPVFTGGSYSPGPYPGYRADYQYRNIDSGFYATAHLIGDQVRIEITTQRETQLRDRRTVSRRESHNSVSGKVGEWIPLANISNQRQQRESDIAMRGTTRFEQREAVWVKVEVLP